jgi:2-octaprenylphenol hydroxylase
MAENHYDIIIVGAGIVGLTLACALSDSHLKIALIDKNPPAVEYLESAIDLRVSAITLASQHIFSKLNVWQNIPAHKISAFNKMHVWEAIGGGHIDFTSQSIYKQNLGFIIENRCLQTALWMCLQQKSIDFIVGQVEVIRYLENNVEIILNSNDVFSTTLLVGADGAQSKVRKQMNVDVTSWEYKHTAIIAQVKTELSHQKTAWQCFLPTGPLAFLPLSDAHQTSIVWSASPSEAQRLLALDDQIFSDQLTQVFQKKLGKIEVASQRLSFPLTMRHVKNYLKPGMALIGDAAHTIHPLAGQGVNLGILDAIMLAETILNTHKKGRLIGALYNLRAYERARKSENWIMLAVVEAIKHLFAGEALPLATLRTLGLNATNKIDFIKNYLMRHAMGLTAHY